MTVAQTKVPTNFMCARLPYLLITAVCDIRGFTELTARVDEYCHSNLVTRESARKMAKDYSAYVDATQDRAHTLIVQPLHELHGYHRNPKTGKKHQTRRLRYGLKATGDGFMIAVGLNEVGKDGIKAGDRYNPYWGKVAVALGHGLKAVIDDAKWDEPSGKGKHNAVIGHLTSDFISEHARLLGIPQPGDECYKQSAGFVDKRAFTIAGAMTLGVGGLTSHNEEDHSATSENDAPFICGDAYGHPVNLAFRLCNEASRKLPDTQNQITPELLLDRRIARLLLEQNDPINWKIEPYVHPHLPKGIEETWCFSLRIPE